MSEMVDSDAVRSRRRRQHQAGDHSLCLPGRCDVARAAADSTAPVEVEPIRVVLQPLPDGRVPGAIEAAVSAFVESLPYAEPDPRALLCLVAIRLAQRVDETGAVPAAVRELRVLLLQLTEIPNGPAGVVDEVRLKSAQRRLDTILAAAG